MVYHTEFSRIIKRPIGKVYPWLTDYEPQDARFVPERKYIRIISKRGDRVEFRGEDGDGTTFVTKVKLRPPNRWEATYEGDLLDESINYSLDPTPEGYTKFTFSCNGTYKGSKASWTQKQVQEELEDLWDRIISTLEKEVAS